MGKFNDFVKSVWNKALPILGLTIVANVIGFLIWWFIVSPIRDYVLHGDGWTELRLYFRLFLFLLSIITFGILRMYNSVVQNTKFIIKTREVIGRLLQQLPGLDRVLRELKNSNANLKTSIDKLDKKVSDNTDQVESLRDVVAKSRIRAKDKEEGK